ncbi:pre-mRNA-processing factor 19-like [Olea europaea var. sylvestris]|uniref:pre-mRNA-processing factor 19-like n=1 Tax=Olea europaea var. sylvestris TaxID=158386 RepID=UPI000C1D3D35|nr:pre-mRNA-processing factor 19-like [Olea europaea var. sylvestris]XP_022871408.1 pre-mRNA-processing factor 19-like [Olea europaea var. sylvestris]
MTASLDNTWCFYEIASGLCLAQVEETSGSSEGYTSASFHTRWSHPWNQYLWANAARIEGHVGAVTAISFSENGYFLATAAQDGVKL